MDESPLEILMTDAWDRAVHTTFDNLVSSKWNVISIPTLQAEKRDLAKMMMLNENHNMASLMVDYHLFVPPLHCSCCRMECCSV